MKKLFQPKSRLIFGFVLLVACAIGWPYTALTVAKTEPPVILGISWLALILTAIDIIFTATVAMEAEEKDD